MAAPEGLDEEEAPQRRLKLINFAHTQWGFNNWNWAVTKQDLDFVETSNGKYTAGVVSFVSVTVKTLNIHRENIGYATSTATHKGAAIHNSRKCAVTNALRETLLSFGGNVASELMDMLELLRNNGTNHNTTQPQDLAPADENDQNAVNTSANIPPGKSVLKVNKEEVSGVTKPIAPLKNMVSPPVAMAHPMPANVSNVPPNVSNVPPNVLNFPPNVPNVPNVGNRPQPMANMPRYHPPAPHILRPNSNEVNLEDMSEEDARAERKRRQKQAQEEFRLKQLMKQKDMDDNQEVNKNSTLDTLLMAIPSQDIVIPETGNTAVASIKRTSPDGGAGGGAAKRRSVSKLDIIPT